MIDEEEAFSYQPSAISRQLSGRRSFQLSAVSYQPEINSGTNPIFLPFS